MDFIVGYGIEILEFSESLKSISLESPDQWSARRIGSFQLCMTGCHYDSFQDKCYIMDGQFSIDGNYFSNLLPKYDDKLMGRTIDKLIADGPRSADSGVFCVGFVTPDGLDMIVDALWQFPLYWSRIGSGWLVSNNIQYIQFIMAKNGENVNIILDSCIENMVFGGNIAGSTHVEQIRLVPFGCKIRGSHVLKFIKFSNVKVGNYEELLESASRSVTRHVESVYSAMHRDERKVVVDITGGRDSRCVLSFILKSGFKGEMSGRCISIYPSPDANIAGGIMSKFDIPVACVPVVQTVAAKHVNELAVRNNAALWGGLRSASAPVPGRALSNVIHFSGAFGEIGGGLTVSDYVSEAIRRAGKYSAALAVDIWMERRRMARALQLLTNDAVESVRKKLIISFL
uniref:hypothetical protein n=1 Tax=Niveispirillum sp. TaxID=1917217 RepID=UPI001B7700B3